MTHPGMLPKVLQCEQKIGYQFTDQNLCWEALQHAGNGVSQAGTRFILNGNKRLAILGDMVLATVLSKEWYNSGDSQGEPANLSKAYTGV